MLEGALSSHGALLSGCALTKCVVIMGYIVVANALWLQVHCRHLCIVVAGALQSQHAFS